LATPVVAGKAIGRIEGASLKDLAFNSLILGMPARSNSVMQPSSHGCCSTGGEHVNAMIAMPILKSDIVTSTDGTKLPIVWRSGGYVGVRFQSD